MLEVAAFAVFSWCAAVGVRNAWRVTASIRWIESAATTAVAVDGEPTLTFVILVPLLREQVIVEPLLRRMAALEWDGTAGGHVVFVTTAREGDGPGSTAEVLEEALRKHGNSRFVHLHVQSGQDGSKADQLNFALEELGLAGTGPEAGADHVFVGVYDADSSPDPRTLTYVAALAQVTPDLKAIQQVPLYFQNLRDPRSVSELYLMTRPFHNLLFALTIEVPCMRRQARVFASPARSLRRVCGGWLSHGLGHGQFFRLDVVTELGGFQPPSCDTQFGHALAFCGIPIHPHPMLDVGQTPTSVSVLLRQGVVWFNSMNTFWRTNRYVDRLRDGDYNHPAAWAMMLKLVHSNVAWAAYPIVFVAALGYSVAGGHWLLTTCALVAWAVYMMPIALILRRFEVFENACRRFEPIAGLSRRSKIGIIGMFGVEKLAACLSPIMWCGYSLRRLIRGKEIRLYKTERAAG